MKIPTLATVFVAAFAASSCLASRAPQMPLLATAQVSNDFGSYEIRRVGLLPFQGKALAVNEREKFQDAFLSEVARSTPYELILLDPNDLEMIEDPDPHRLGWYKPKTVIELSERYSLDAILFGTVTDERFFPPQLLSLTIDMVSAETGLVIWSSAIHLDANDPRVIDGLQAYYLTDDDPESWRVALISPERFARFAAYQVACLL